MPGAKLSDDEFRQLEEKVLTIESGALLVISGSLPPGVSTEKLTALIQAAQHRGIRCIVDSSGEAYRRPRCRAIWSWSNPTRKS